MGNGNRIIASRWISILAGLLFALLGVGCESATPAPSADTPVAIQIRFHADGADTRAPAQSAAASVLSGSSLALPLEAAERGEVERIFLDIFLAESGDPFVTNFDLTRVATDEWSGEVPLLPRNRQLRFAARALDGNDVLVFSGETFATLAVNSKLVEIPLAPAQDGQTLAMPRLSRIVYPAEITTGHEEQVAFTVHGNAGTEIMWRITASGSPTAPSAAFSPASGTLTLGGTVASFATVFAAPAVEASASFDYQVTLTTQGAHGAVSITTNFHTIIKPLLPGLPIAIGTRPSVRFNPIILSLTANGSETAGAVELVAEVSDDGAQTALTYQWSYAPNPGTAGATFANAGQQNPAMFEGYTTAHAGTLTLAVTDEHGGTTTLHYQLLAGQFADAVDHVPASGIQRIVAGSSHTCALIGAGRVRCWGDNAYGQLGYGNTTDVGDTRDRLPHHAGDVPLPEGDPVVQLAAGNQHTCALLTSGMISCWGRNHVGQLGYGRIDSLGDDEPVTAWGYVPVGALAARVVTGGDHTCAISHDGAMRCWGHNDRGQLGRNSTANLGDDEPVYRAGDLNLGAGVLVRDAALGNVHTCALLTTGAVRCWGGNDYGQLGYGHSQRLGDNEPISGLPNLSLTGAVRKLVAGGHHTCALTLSGSLRCWGRGELGQLGQNTGGGSHWGEGGGELPSTLPGDISIGNPISDVIAGGNHTCALSSHAQLKCWGLGTQGQLGQGNFTTLRTPPATAVAMDDAAPYRVTAGAEHTCAQRKDGSVRCWGTGGDGRLGRGSTASSPSATGNAKVHIFPPGPNDPPPPFFYGYTGEVQTVVVPTAVRSVEIKAWGAGGGGAVGALGGGGGFSRSAILAVTPGQTLSIVVGQGGRYGVVSAAFGGGGIRRPGGPAGCGGTYFDPPISGGGGGYSGVFLGAVVRTNALVVAGGGGGGGGFGGTGGAGGGAIGGVSNISSGAGGGGTQTAGGAAGIGVSSGMAGAALLGGNSDCAGQGGGGGGGYFGGGGSGAINGGDPGGGGGSGYAPGGSTVAGAGSAPAMSADVDYVTGVGNGGLADTHGGNGYVVITFF